MATHIEITVQPDTWTKIADSGDNATCQLQTGGIVWVRQEDEEPSELKGGVIYKYKELIGLWPATSNVWVRSYHKDASIEIQKD